MIQGDNIAKALEQVYQSSYLNNTYNISNMIPSELRVHSAVFNRLGQSPFIVHQAVGC